MEAAAPRPLAHASREIGATILNFLAAVGGTSMMLMGVFARLHELPRTARQTFLQMQWIGIGSTTGNVFASRDRGDSWSVVSNYLPPVHAVTFADG